MTKLPLFAGLSALALAGGVAFAAPNMRADANGDGALTRVEVTTAVARRFARLDADRDGTVTAAERTQVRAERQARRDQRAERREDRLPRLFARVDANGDGGVTRAELDGAIARAMPNQARNAGRRNQRLAALFAQADRNADGRVTLDEARTAMAGIRGRTGARIDGPRRDRPALTRARAEERAFRVFARFDANQDGRLSAAELQAGRDARAQRRANRG